MKKRILLLAALAVVALFVLSACGNDQNNNSSVTPNQSTTQPNQTPNMTADKPNSASDNTAKEQNIYSESRSQAIKDAITSEISNANEAWVMVSDNTAFIALDIKAEDNATESSDIKEEVAKIVLNTDKDITDVYITADADTLTRLKDTFKDLANGKPISGLTAEIMNLFTRITPSKTTK